jgi:DNA-binding transcriptional ArsR family regulator
MQRLTVEDPFILTRDAIKVLSVDTRLDILKLLDERPHTLTEIKDVLGLAAATVSEHLAKLEEANLIEKRDEGRKWKYYRLTTQGEKLFAKRPAAFTFAFVVSTIAAGGFAIASLLRTTSQGAPMMARSESSGTQMLMAEDIAEPLVASPDWFFIAAVGFALLSLVLFVIMLAKRLKRAR